MMNNQDNNQYYYNGESCDQQQQQVASTPLAQFNLTWCCGVKGKPCQQGNGVARVGSKWCDVCVQVTMDAVENKKKKKEKPKVYCTKGCGRVVSYESETGVCRECVYRAKSVLCRFVHHRYGTECGKPATANTMYDADPLCSEHLRQQNLKIKRAKSDFANGVDTEAILKNRAEKRERDFEMNNKKRHLKMFEVDESIDRKSVANYHDLMAKQAAWVTKKKVVIPDGLRQMDVDLRARNPEVYREIESKYSSRSNSVASSSSGSFTSSSGNYQFSPQQNQPQQPQPQYYYPQQPQPQYYYPQQPQFYPPQGVVQLPPFVFPQQQPPISQQNNNHDVVIDLSDNPSSNSNVDNDDYSDSDDSDFTPHENNDDNDNDNDDDDDDDDDWNSISISHVVSPGLSALFGNASIHSPAY